MALSSGEVGPSLSACPSRRDAPPPHTVKRRTRPQSLQGKQALALAGAGRGDARELLKGWWTRYAGA
jgi:hypothetical protein